MRCLIHVIGLFNVFAAFCRLGIKFCFDFISLYPYFPVEITTPMKFWPYLVSKVSFNLHAIHLLIASSKIMEIDLIH